MALSDLGGSQGDYIALLGKGSSFEGKLTFEGPVRIDGNFKGEIFSEHTLMIGETAEIQAEITVAKVIIQGQVHGNIVASESIEMKLPARLVGNITTPALSVEKGVIYEGSCTMPSSGDDRFKSRTKPVAAPPVAPLKDLDKGDKAPK